MDNFEFHNTARQFRGSTYDLIRQVPPEGRFCLSTQIRRAAVSVTNNIAEGHGRWHFQENIQFCRISRGSLGELLDDFNTCLDENYGPQELVTELKENAR